MIEFVSGYCPVLKHEYSIEINYSQATQNKYIKSGAYVSITLMLLMPNVL